MVAEVRSGAVLGIDGYGVTVEIDIARGLPAFTIVGLPTAAVRESRERVTAAIKNVGLEFPQRRITANLAPADIRKEGAAFDLPIAVGILAASSQTLCPVPVDTLILGELALDGRLKAVRGVLPIALFAREAGYARMLVPEANAEECSFVHGIDVVPCSSLAEALNFLGGGEARKIKGVVNGESSVSSFDLDYSDVLGQPAAKRAMEVAAAGGHHILMVGPPGSGKTMLAQRLPSILPPMDEEESLECAKIASVSGRKNVFCNGARPFRAPHHSTSDAGLIGGGRAAAPGEITLAHNGVLFLDEITEFRRNVLECLRQPLEEGLIVIARANLSCRYPARFQLVAAMNPCPCGYAGSQRHICTCSPKSVRQYRSRISGPLIDRIAIHVALEPVDSSALEASFASNSETSTTMRARISRAYEIQRGRFASFPSIRRNAEMPVADPEGLCGLSRDGMQLLSVAQKKLLFSARARRNIIQVARTIADLEESRSIEAHHVAEAIQYRVPRDLSEC